jgi:hypothetical protein
MQVDEDVSADLIEEAQLRGEHLQVTKLDVNKASLEDLQAIDCLTDFQVMSLWNYIEQHRPLLSVWELSVVPGFDAADVTAVARYLYVDDKTRPTPVKRRNGWLAIKEQWSETREDDSLVRDSRYEGKPFRTLARLKYDYKDYTVGMVAEKDPGEHFGRQGFDFYSAHVALRGRGLLKTLVLGDYNARFGQGLTLWTGPSFGTYSLAPLRKHERGIAPCAGTNENLFCRGVGAELGFRPLRVSVALSRHDIDATLDSTRSLLTSFQTTGYHRTPAEMSSRHSVTHQMAALNIDTWLGPLSLGATGAIHHFDKPLSPDTSVYNLFAPRGQVFENLGLHSFAHVRSADCFGEVAIDKNRNLALLAGVEFMLRENVGLGFVYRDYPPGYYAMYASGISRSGDTRNERGLLIVMNLKPDTLVSFTLSGDYFTRPWLTRGVSAPSDGYSLATALAYNPVLDHTLAVQYRYTRSSANMVGQDSGVAQPVEQEKHSARLSYRNAFSPRWSSLASVAVVHTTGERGTGMAFFQEVQWVPRAWLGLSCRYYMFSASYANRVYIYEPDVSGGSFSSFSDDGTKFMITCKLTVSRHISVSVLASRLNKITAHYGSTTAVSLYVKYSF